MVSVRAADRIPRFVIIMFGVTPTKNTKKRALSLPMSNHPIGLGMKKPDNITGIASMPVNRI